MIKNLHLFGMAVLSLLILTGIAAVSHAREGEVAQDTIRVPIASASTKKEWINEAVKDFNSRSKTHKEFQVDGRPIFIEVIEEEIEPYVFDHYRSGSMITDILAGKIEPVAASPGEATWLRKLNSDWKATYGKQIYTDTPTPLLQTPIII